MKGSHLKCWTIQRKAFHIGSLVRISSTSCHVSKAAWEHQIHSTGRAGMCWDSGRDRRSAICTKGTRTWSFSWNCQRSPKVVMTLRWLQHPNCHVMTYRFPTQKTSKNPWEMVPPNADDANPSVFAWLRECVRLALRVWEVRLRACHQNNEVLCMFIIFCMISILYIYISIYLYIYI